MKIKSVKEFKKLIIGLILIVQCFFCFSGKVEAKDADVGGKLMSPIADLVVFTGDAGMHIIHSIIYKQPSATFTVDTLASNLKKIILGLVFVTAAIVGTILTGGIGTMIVGAFAAAGLTVGTIGVGTCLAVGIASGVFAASKIARSDWIPESLVLPVYQISPEEIFSNNILLFDVDFFHPKGTQKEENGVTVWYETAKDVRGNEIKNGDETLEFKSTAGRLRSVIANWYTALRNIAFLALLSILVYIGIRILISSTANDKGKYKQMLGDWVIAICLLFSMQYIMTFSNIIVEKITDGLKEIKHDGNYVYLLADKDGKIAKGIEELTEQKPVVENLEIDVDDEGKAKSVDVVEYQTNSIGMARLDAQMAKKEYSTYIGYSIAFLVLVLFTYYFIFTYLKRVLYMAFLTIIAPFVAMTYPLDKINDGKAQAFDSWFKEYIFNLLIQPMHLVLYSIIVSSAFELASENIIYTLVALGFLMPAEKLLRRFFGFEKAHTPGLLAGPAGAALAFNGMSKLLGKGPNGGSKSSGNNGSGAASNSDKPPRINRNLNTDFDKEGSLFGNGGLMPEKANVNNKSGIGNRNNQLGDSGLGIGSGQRTGEDIEGLPIGRKETFPGEDDGFVGIGSPIYGNDQYAGIQASNGFASQLDDTTNYLGGYGQIPQNGLGQTDGDIRFNDNYANMPNLGGERNNSTPDLQDQIREQDLLGQIKEKPTMRKKISGFARGAIATGGRMARGGVRAVRPTMRYYARGVGQNLKGRIQNMHPVRKFARTATGVAGAAAAASLGLAVGISSGDASKAFQYTAGAALAGNKFGRGTFDSADALTPEGMSEINRRSAFASDSEYDKFKQERYNKQFLDADKKYQLERKYGVETAKQMMKDDIPTLLNNGINDMGQIKSFLDMKQDGKLNNMDEVTSLMENGVTDINDMEAILEMRQDGRVRNLNQGIAIKKQASRIGKDTTNMNSDDRVKWEKTFTNDYKNKENLQGMDHEQMGKDTFTMVNEFNSTRNQISSAREAGVKRIQSNNNDSNIRNQNNNSINTASSTNNSGRVNNTTTTANNGQARTTTGRTKTERGMKTADSVNENRTINQRQRNNAQGVDNSRTRRNNINNNNDNNNQ